MKWLALALYTLAWFNAIGQTISGEPHLDENYLKSKQFKRLNDYLQKRKSDSNRSLAKWEAWQTASSVKSQKAMDPWQNFGPDTISGRIISIAFHPTDSNTFLVGAASGGLWRTTDYGLSWNCLTDDYFTMGVGAVVYNPQNPNSILIATGEAYGFGNEFTSGFGVFISYDSGITWNTTSLTADLSQSFASTDIYWNPTDTSKVCIGTSYAVAFSNDGGLNYDFVLDRIGGRMVPDPQNPNRLYFAARYYNTTYPGGLYISENSGESWGFAPNTGLPPVNEFGFASIAIHPTYNHLVYVSIGNSSALGSGPLRGLYRSHDFGQTFTEVPTQTDYLCYHEPYDHICQGWFANTLLISEEDTNMLFAGGTRLWRSADGGETWNNIDANPDTTAYAVHPDHHQTLYHPITGALFDCNDGGVNYSYDNGATWSNISDGLITHQFYSIASAATDPNVVIGGTQDVGTFSSTTAHSGGWNQDRSGDSFMHTIDHTNADVWYGTNFMNVIRMKTTSAGNTWFPINNGTTEEDQWRMPMVMHPSNPNTLLSSNNTYMYKTLDGGNSWSAVSAAGFIGTFEYDKTDNNLVYAHRLYDGIMYRSADGGNTWFQLQNSPGTPITDLAASPTSYGKLYATIGSFNLNEQLFMSEDGGANWANISNGLPPVPANTVAINPTNENEIYVGNGLGVWVSTDGGANWQDFSDGLPAAVVVDDLHYYAPDNTVRIGTYGRGYWRTNSLTSVGLTDVSRPSFRIFPNPSEDGLVHLQGENLKEVASIQVYNPLGEVVLSVENYPTTGVRLPKMAGVYLIEVNTENNSQRFKVIRQ